MRNIFVAIFFLIFTYSKGQDYIPTIKDNNVWYVVYTCEGYCSDIIKVLGDTIYNSIEYKIIGSEYHQQNQRYPYYGFIREDTIEQKIYYLPNQNYPQVEELLYDYSVTDGDTVLLNHYGQVTKYFVDSVRYTSTLIDNRKIYYLHGPENQYNYSKKIKWIEGIGSLDYLLNSSDTEGLGTGLTCFYSDETIIYQSELSKQFGTCELTSLEDISSNILDIFPNPFLDYVVIHGDFEVQYLDYQIININGQKLLNKKISVFNGTFNEKVNMENLDNGIYFVRLIAKDFILTKRIIKNANH